MMPNSGILEYCSSPFSSKSFVLPKMTRSITSRLLQACQHASRISPMDRDRHLQPREWHPSTLMSASSKAHVCCNIWSVHNEFIRSLKNLRISVSRCIAESDRLPRSYRFAVEMYVFGGCAGEAAVRAIQPQELLHCSWDQRLVIS
jgi:hypothetical protein